MRIFGEAARDAHRIRHRRDHRTFLNAVLGLLFCCLLIPFSAAARASDGTSDYIAARDRYIKEFAATPPSPEREKAALDDLEHRLREIIPVWDAPNFISGVISLSTLVQDMGFGDLDGLAYGSVVVTTPLLLDRWIADNNRSAKNKADKIPQPLDAAIRSEPFWYGTPLFDDSAPFMFAEIPVKIPGGTGVVLLAGSTQTGFSADGPRYLLAAVFRSGRVFVAHQNLNAQIAQQADCEHQLEEDSYFTIEDSHSTKYDEQAVDRRFQACFATYLRRHPQYAAVQKQAQALVDLLH